LPEPFSTEHLNQLRQRWERDPKSRAFLQLAEEYRRAGRLSDAVHVLQAGLKEHPTYLSAQVALGRCLVESGAADGAVEILERAVARDPTQLVASKLLVEAYLAKGAPGKARERLELYKLFNDRDVEIEPLEARIRALESSGTAAAAATTSATGASPARRAVPPAIPAADPFELPAPERVPAIQLDVNPSAPGFLSATVAREPFGALYATEAAHRIETAFAEQGIFVLAPAPTPTVPLASAQPAPWSAVADIPPAATPATPETVGKAPLPAVAPLPALPAIAPTEWPGEVWPDVTAQAGEPSAEAEPAAVPAPFAPVLPESEAPPRASSTLGELYLAQGHLDEAEASFQSVLHSRPGDAAALAGLESVRLQRGEEAAVFADEAVGAEESNVIVGGLTARKAALLKDYLARIRRGAKRHVS
jgi:tetratricopeptide (TPR) repeat protein